MSECTHKRIGVQIILLIVLLSFPIRNAFSENLKTLVNLKGYWQFSIGDDPTWALPNCNDQSWDRVMVPETWEQNGYEDYNGFAWYRKHFQITIPVNRDFLYLNIGYIDDVDEVYFNGKLIGASGDFPPVTRTAYNIPRMYPIPVDLVNRSGDNVLAVRVFDDYYEGGIIRGDISIVIDLDQDKLDVDLSGFWDFEVNRNIDKGNLNVVTYKPGKIFVPGFWEARGYNGVDGRAMYAKKFRFPSNLDANNQVLILGVVDDWDKVFLNGQEIGSADQLRKRRGHFNGLPDHLAFRIYPIPANLLNKTGLNQIEVVVNDNIGPGGIYKGPIGLASKEKAAYILQDVDEESRSLLERFLEYLLD